MEWTEINSGEAGPSLRNSHRIAATEEYLIVHGGRGGSATLKDLYVFDPEQEEWFKPLMKSAAPARENHAVAVQGDIVYVFGGSDSGSLCNEMYQLDTNMWKWTCLETNGVAPTPRERHSMTLCGNKLFVFGGRDVDNDYLNDLYMFDLESHSWSQVNSNESPIPRQHHTAVAIEGVVYIFGGKSNSGCFNDVQAFDTEAMEWVQPEIQNISPAGRWGHTAAAFGPLMIVHGGWNGTWCFADTNVFNTQTSMWTRISFDHTAKPTPPGRAYHALACFRSTVYLFAGRNGVSRMKDMFKLNLSSLDTDALSDTKHTAIGTVSTASWKLSDFELRNTLGTGSFGRVRLARHIPTDSIVAIKMLKKSEIIRLKQVDHILAEKSILESIENPFVVNLKGSFQDERYLYLVMEFVVGGEFFTHLRRAGRFNNDSSCFYAAQIVLIFQYLHSKDIVYRDLKPENLLLDHLGNVKLTDFGFAKKVEYRTWTLCGTPEYIAPEILLNKGHGKSVDWWALGIMIFEMLAGGPPFSDNDPMGIYQKILAGRITFPRYFDSHAKDLIRKLLTPDITNRLGNLKNGVEDIKRHKWFAKIDWGKLYSREMRVPFVPEVKGMDNPNNFEKYPETTPEPPAIDSSLDPFKEF